MEQIDKKNEEILKKITEEVLEKMSFSSEVEIIKNEEDNFEKRLVCSIKTTESSFLIGQHGGNLDALEHLIRILVRKKIEDKIKFIIDINNYRQEKNDSVVALAKSMAEKALMEKRAIVLRPMTPYERRLIHLELSENSQVITESIGENENRKIIIKPIGLI